MRDDLDQQLDDFGTSMPAIDWASPTEIRKRGDRRRQRHTAGLTAAVVLVVALAAGTAVTVTQGRGGQVTPGVSGSATPSASAAPSLSPSPSASPSPSTSPSASAPPAVLTSIPVAAMLKPEDYASGYRVTTEDEMGESYGFDMQICLDTDQWDGKPEAPDTVDRPRRNRRLGADGRGQLRQDVVAMRSVSSAKAVLKHSRTGFEKCAMIQAPEGRRRAFEIVAQDFAGDESFMVQWSTVQLLVFIRVGTVVITLSMPPDAKVATTTETAKNAVQRLCDATAVC
ncbi:hypothetical protein CS0771_12640 [Catellatospora sp. IY07-71]|uniref:hypothetical protein n=1 Tax=Catellatospora sp. IY07-71 TaxID=2728827 RepID=UPI001BB3CA70|nr:hypothetical protein [Catellatospora sp. IY07-71]BCJ71720.1 hypothetical protein CS0771_12640 [Catellatospora sp. IY07-71]